MSVSIRKAETDDCATIVEFNSALAEETESKKLNETTLQAGVNAVLADSAKGAYFLAEINGKIVGQTMVTLEWSDWRNGVFWWIQSVYVAPAHRGDGVFGELYRHIYEQAINDPDVCGLRLYVDLHNQHAADVYRALGMHDSSYKMLELDFTSGH
ncbi:MAG: GNAT family N-acetyltransferase [Gammaproteobacteria bacterium]|nr:GNAT family N-acetyltransferase [Gammaproteobacteria bacterium]